jgi:hypothetical protein
VQAGDLDLTPLCFECQGLKCIWAEVSVRLESAKSETAMLVE